MSIISAQVRTLLRPEGPDWQSQDSGGITEEGDEIGEAGMPGAPHFYCWQVMGFERGNRAQEAGGMIARVAQRDLAWLAY